ncbi:hypothetical protein GCM10022409_00990 [Hymenobacter glaciei]|uniref:Cardiolipin synthase N-terminal domain-containing protein n=1 Tax=Hymenobacter glaciei TaxID=877209 RepID=A0ABP7T5T9_9BACT
MKLFLFLLSYWEFYVFEIPYMMAAVWIYRTLSRKQYRNVWTQLVTGALFWIVFFLGFIAVAFGAEILIMLRHAENI